MAEREELQKQYAYHEMSSKVVQADRSARRSRRGEPTGEVESLRGRTDVGRMGDRVVTQKPELPAGRFVHIRIPPMSPWTVTGVWSTVPGHHGLLVSNTKFATNASQNSFVVLHQIVRIEDQRMLRHVFAKHYTILWQPRRCFLKSLI